MKQLVKLASGRYSLPVLNNIYVKDGVAFATCLDNALTYPCDKPDGLYIAKGIAAGAWVKDTLPIDDYPSEAIHLGNRLAEKTITIEALEWVARAMSSEETRYYLCAINFDSAGIVATDGHRLHMVKSESEITGSYLVPSSAVKIILACAKDEKVNSLAFHFSETKFSVQVGKYQVKGKLTDGTFPDYRRVIPKAPEHETVYKHKELSSVAKEVRGLFKAHGLRNGDGLCVVEGGKLSVRAGDFSKSFPISIKTGDIRVGFNFRYLEGIGIDGALQYSGPIDPIQVTAGDKLALLMPVRI